jgi:hypothetical protein
MPEKFGGSKGPEGDGKIKDPLDIEFDAFLSREPQESLEPKAADKGYQELMADMSKKLAAARESQARVNAVLQVSRWLLDKYPAIRGGMTFDEFIDFLKEEKVKLDKAIKDNGGKV